MSGSSPLTRGKRGQFAPVVLSRGLIPAHARKTTNELRSWASWWAHPHSRGENEKCTVKGVRQMGSSPLTRGKRFTGCESLGSFGLIPTHAGKTSISTASLSRRRAHPRSREENRVLYGSLSDVQGSSPLTREKRIHCSSQRHQPGFIPAHAGKTGSGGMAGIGCRAHPRSRGENLSSAGVMRRASGSSPLTRRKLGCWRSR